MSFWKFLISFLLNHTQIQTNQISSTQKLFHLFSNWHMIFNIKMIYNDINHIDIQIGLIDFEGNKTPSSDG